MKRRTFSYLQKKYLHQKSIKETDFLKIDKDLLTRFLIVTRTRKVDLGEILTHCLSQFSSSLSNSDGSLQRINKAVLFHNLQAKFPDMKIIKIPQNTALVLDGQTIIQQLEDHIPATFDDLNIYIFRYIIKLFFFLFTCHQELILYVISTILRAFKILKEDGVQFPLATCWVFLIRIRKHLSCFGNSSCLAKNTPMT